MNKVEPIRSLDTIQEIKDYLLENESPRNYLLFVLGINFALRVSDLVSLKVKDVRNPNNSIKGKVYLRESKTNKEKTIAINNTAKEALEFYFDKVNASQDNWLFPSESHDCAINRSWVWELIQRWVSKVGLEGKYGSHSLRKAWGYVARVHYDVPIELIQSKFNHQSPNVTRRYIGIEDEEIAEIERKVEI